MSKHLTRFIVSLCLLLAGVNGYSSLVTTRVESPVVSSGSAVEEQTDQTQQDLHFVTTSVDEKHELHKLEGEELEEKDDEFLFSSDFFGRTDYLHGPSYSFLSAYLNLLNSGNYFFESPASNQFSTSRFLTFCVFRI